MNFQRIKIGVSIFLSLLISFVLMRFITLGDKPVFDFQKAQNEIQTAQITLKDSISGSLAHISIPLFTFTPISSVTSTVTEITPTSGFISNNGSSAGQVQILPSAIPTSIPNGVILPTQIVNQSSSTLPSQTPFPTTDMNEEPTDAPNPTKGPKPTKIPKPTKVPLLKLEARRPGNSFEEVMEIVSPIICVPVPMMHATLENEYGPWLSKIEAEWDNKNTMQGADTTAVSGSQAIVGVTQMMSDTWFRIKSYVMAKFTVDDMSLNVTFDSIAASAYHQRNVSLAGQDHQPCDDWDVKYILYAACRYNGACPANTMGQTNYYNEYTYKVCDAYNRYTKGPKKNCK